MKDDHINGHIVHNNPQINAKVGKIVGDNSSWSKDKVQQGVRKTPPDYGELRKDLQRRWVIF